MTAVESEGRSGGRWLINRGQFKGLHNHTRRA